MTALLTTDTAAVLCHILIDVLVAHGGLVFMSGYFVPVEKICNTDFSYKEWILNRGRLSEN